jgi:hypothetical protein
MKNFLLICGRRKVSELLGSDGVHQWDSSWEGERHDCNLNWIKENYDDAVVGESIIIKTGEKHIQ